MMEFVGEQLERVVLLHQSDDDPVRLLSAELFADGLMIRWMRRPHPAVGSNLDQYVGLVVTDDVGTVYALSSEQVLATGPGYHGHTVFLPAVPPNARELVVQYLDNPEVRASLL